MHKMTSKKYTFPTLPAVAPLM